MLSFNGEQFGSLFCFSNEKTQWVIYLTADGRATWKEAGIFPGVDAESQIGSKFGGAFATAEIGFLCGSKGTDPFLLQTGNSGGTWKVADISLPDEAEYDSARCDAPVFSGQYGVLKVVLMYDNANAKSVCFASGDYGGNWTYWGPDSDLTE